MVRACPRGRHPASGTILGRHPPGVTGDRRKVHPDALKTESLMTIKPTVGYTTPMKNNGLRVKRESGPSIEKPTATPRRPTNAAVRPREYLTGEEIRRLLKTARTRAGAKFPHRDATMILMGNRRLTGTLRAD